jgi:hypothetical protein
VLWLFSSHALKPKSRRSGVISYRAISELAVSVPLATGKTRKPGKVLKDLCAAGGSLPTEDSSASALLSRTGQPSETFQPEQAGAIAGEISVGMIETSGLILMTDTTQTTAFEFTPFEATSDR